MSDYKVGKGSGKDRYTVGYNKGSDIYKVGGGGSKVSESSSSQLGGGDQASPAGAKSAFNYAHDKDSTYKDIGDSSDNMNFGGGDVMGTNKSKDSVAGQLQLSYTEKGDWSMEKDAMARRKAMMENSRKYMSTSEFNSPTADIVDVKKG